MEHVQQTIETAAARLRDQEAAVIETKKLINSLLGLIGQPPRFSDPDVRSEAVNIGFRRDQFYGQPMSAVVRTILASRKDSTGPASVNEIYDAMIAGGFKFETANEDNARRVLRISLTKNTQTFHRLPSGMYGLREWYPNIKDAKSKSGSSAAGEPTPATADDAPGAFDFDKKEKVAEKDTAAA